MIWFIFLRGNQRGCYKDEIHFGELEGIAGAAVRFGNLWEERVLPRIFWTHNAAKFGRTPAAFRNRNTWVCACACVRDEVCCGAARWRAHKSPCVRGNTARPGEAEREKKEGARRRQTMRFLDAFIPQFTPTFTNSWCSEDVGEKITVRLRNFATAHNWFLQDLIEQKN